MIDRRRCRGKPHSGRPSVRPSSLDSISSFSPGGVDSFGSGNLLLPSVTRFLSFSLYCTCKSLYSLSFLFLLNHPFCTDVDGNNPSLKNPYTPYKLRVSSHYCFNGLHVFFQNTYISNQQTFLLVFNITHLFRLIWNKEKKIHSYIYIAIILLSSSCSI